LPCKCGAIRVIYKKLLCPNCESIEIIDPKTRIEETEKQLHESLINLDENLKNVNPELTIRALLIEREKVAQKCLTQAMFKGDAIKRWLSISFLLSKYPWKGSGSPNRSLIEYLIFSAEEILEYENALFRLKNDIEEIIRVNGSEVVVPTELDILHAIPEDVMKQYERQLTLAKEIVGDRNQPRNLDLFLVREIMVQPSLPLLIGDEIYRHLRRTYPHRILPLLRPRNVHDFIQMTLKLAGLIAFQLGQNFADQYGILETDAQFLEEVKSFLFTNENAKVDWFFRQLGNYGKRQQKSLGETVIFKTMNGTVFLPYFSLYLLVHLCLRWEKSPEKGEYYRYIGKTMEDVIFSFVSAYSVRTNHPITGKPLRRVPHPEKSGEEIADVMAYNDQYLVVIESKFRETLTVKDLEAELCKFHKKLDYIKYNLVKLGFPENLEIKPFFYVPYPPYTEWRGIKLIPSIVLLGVELSHFLEFRPIELAPRSQRLQQILQKIKEPTPYPVDLSLIDESIPPDTYRIQDGVVEDYDDKEITVLIDNPIGLPTMLIVDISDSIFNELKTVGVNRGDVIKMVLLNLNKTWTQIQLVEFKLISRYMLPRSELDVYGLLSILQQNSGHHTIEKLILQTWGEKLGKEILGILKKWNIDFPLFLKHQEEKGQNILIAVGKLLGLADTYEKLVQCKCGEVLGLNSEILKVMEKLYPEGIRCPKCDPEQLNRLRKMGYQIKKTDYSALIEHMLRSSRKDIYR